MRERAPGRQERADARWRAVLARDAAADGRFVFAVRSTGIYCRPSCPARRPLRAHVVFYPQPEAAERAGFRPCRRCRPRHPRPDPHAAWVQQVCQRLAPEDERVTLAQLGAEVGISPHHLQRTFKRILGVTPRQYADALRVGRLKAGLKGGRDVTEATYEAGYGSGSRVYERADAHLGMTPGTYRRGGAGMRIAYTIADSPLGRLLVAATERGLSAVSLAGSDAALERGLRAEYPAAELRRDDGRLGPWLAAVLGHLSGAGTRLDLPLDIRATAFQRRVWEALQAIPPGQTRSYAEVARSLGRPRAARAVARACATNPAALVIPCHRVVAAGGGLGGYRWGVERKRALLARERAAAKAGG